MVIRIFMQKLKRFFLSRYAWCIVLCGCAVYGTTLGALGYTVGNFFLPISREFGCGIGEVSLYVTINSIVIALFIPLTRAFTARHMRLSLSLGAGLLVLALLGMSQVKSLWQLYGCAVILGAGSGFFNGATVPTLIDSWFYKKKGTALGICLSSAALIGAIMNPVLSGIIAASSWRSGYLFLAGLVAVVLLPLMTLVIRPDPASMGLKPYGFDPAAAPAQSGKRADNALTGLSMKEALATFPFWAMMLMAPAFSIGFGLTSHLPTYASSIGIGASAGAILTSASLVGGMLGKLTLGMLNDRFSTRVPLCAAQLCVVLGVGVLFVSQGSPLLLGLGALIFGYGSCTTALMPAMLTSALFGQRDYNRILTWFTTSSSLLGGFGSTLYGLLYDAAGDYISSMLVCMAVASLCLLLGLASLWVAGKKDYAGRI